MKQFNPVTIKYLPSLRALAYLSIFVLSFGVASAAAVVPGVVPQQAPLQPMPQGTAPNISNNIVQTPESGAPDSAATIEQGTITTSEGTELMPDENNLHAQPVFARANTSAWHVY